MYCIHITVDGMFIEIQMLVKLGISQLVVGGCYACSNNGSSPANSFSQYWEHGDDVRQLVPVIVMSRSGKCVAITCLCNEN